MAGELQAVIDKIITEMVALGIRKVPNDPPEQINAFPVAVVYSTSGRDVSGPPESRTSHQDVTIAVMVPLKDMPRQTAAMLLYRDSVPAQIYSAQRAGRFSSLIYYEGFTRIDHTLGPILWSGQEMFGLLFIIRDLKYQSDIP